MVKVKALRFGPVVPEGDCHWGHCTFAVLRDAMVNAWGFWDHDSFGDPTPDEVAQIFSLQTQIAEMPEFQQFWF